MNIQPLINIPNGIPPKDKQPVIIWNKKPSFGLSEIKKKLTPNQIDTFVKKYPKDDQKYLKGIITKAGNQLDKMNITIGVYDSWIRTAIGKVKEGLKWK